MSRNIPAEKQEHLYQMMDEANASTEVRDQLQEDLRRAQRRFLDVHNPKEADVQEVKDAVDAYFAAHRDYMAKHKALHHQTAVYNREVGREVSAKFEHLFD